MAKKIKKRFPFQEDMDRVTYEDNSTGYEPIIREAVEEYYESGKITRPEPESSVAEKMRKEMKKKKQLEKDDLGEF